MSLKKKKRRKEREISPKQSLLGQSPGSETHAGLEEPKGTVKLAESLCFPAARAEFHIPVVKLSQLRYVWGQNLQAIMPFFALHKILRMNA